MINRHGFIFLFGTRTFVSNDGSPIPATCPQCGQTVAFQNKVARNWFTLFFIPVFPIAAGQKICQCSHCKMRFATSAQNLVQRVASTDSRKLQHCIQMFNSLRASPANSVTLNQLFSLYLEIGEYDQALSAAHEFPQALNASEQCMTTLARILVEMGRFPDALKWLDAALARNPMSGETAYCKALALLKQTPPDLTSALSAARVARSADFPRADALIRDIEERSRTATV